MELAYECPGAVSFFHIHVLTDIDASGSGVGQHDPGTGLLQRLEPSSLVGERAAANFFRTWRRLAGILQRDAFTRLPAGVDAVCEPHRAIRFRERGLSARRFAIGLVIRARRERYRRNPL